MAERLASLQRELEAGEKGARLLAVFSRKARVRGLFIHGGVGRGKSMLMDVFISTCKLEKKRRVHFHEFMREIHEAMREARRGKGDPVPEVAAGMAKSAELLCLDEFEVRDVADSMILGRLFREMVKRGVVFVITSNLPPEEHYKGGLQRDRYLQFVDYLREAMDVAGLDSGQDYRMKKLPSLERRYFYPLGMEAADFLARAFAMLAAGGKVAPHTIHVHGREIVFEKSCGGIAMASFQELCCKPLGASDYMEIAKEFDTLLVSGIPVMGPEMRNEARRFVMLIDELYERGVALIAAAAAPPEALYPHGTGSFEFKRTVSRLAEMQSEEYVAKRG